MKEKKTCCGKCKPRADFAKSAEKPEAGCCKTKPAPKTAPSAP